MAVARLSGWRARRARGMKLRNLRRQVHRLENLPGALVALASARRTAAFRHAAILKAQTDRPEALPASAAPDGREPQQCQHPGSGPVRIAGAPPGGAIAAAGLSCPRDRRAR